MWAPVPSLWTGGLGRRRGMGVVTGGVSRQSLSIRLWLRK
jgi:hypothetical protein